MTLLASYLIAVMFLILLPLLLTLWTALKRQRYINQYITGRNSEMTAKIINMQKTIEDYVKEIKEQKQGKGTKEAG